MNTTQAFNMAMNRYPSLWHSDTLEGAKLRFFDHIFNTIGNGYNDLESFISEHSITDDNFHLIHTYPQKYTDGSQLYSCYTAVREMNIPKSDGNTHLRPVPKSCLDELLTQGEIDKRSDIRYRIEVTPHPFAPYPNFGREYSFVWKTYMSQLDVSWTKSAVWYYEKCQEYFKSGAAGYSQAAPSDPDELARRIAEYDTAFEKYESHEKISKAYELEYNGDTKDFIERQWSQELSRIQAFISETLEYLVTTPKMKFKK